MLREALEREMSDSMAHFAMGMLRRIQNRLTDSQIELETSIALDRNNARAFQQLGVTLMCLGEPEHISVTPSCWKARALLRSRAIEVSSSIWESVSRF